MGFVQNEIETAGTALNMIHPVCAQQEQDDEERERESIGFDCHRTAI